MVKIAICDDEEKSVALHERMVRECLQAAGIGCEITTYTQSRNLLYDITDDAFFYDLILLDIEMPGISGMELPQQIKGFLPNVRIIFVTSHTEYAIDALNYPSSAMFQRTTWKQSCLPRCWTPQD